MRSRVLVPACIAACAAVFALPAAAVAHGLVQRADLPIPEWLFGWAAAIVLVVSFAALAVLWPRPKLEHDEWRPLPRAGAALASRPVEWAAGTFGVVALALVVLAGYLGPPGPQDNLAPTAFLVIFWVGLVPLSVLFGDVFRALNPWRALGRALRLRGLRPYPDALGRWPAAIGILAFTWFELAYAGSESPRAVATFLVVYTVVQLGGMAAYGHEAWSRRGDAFGVYFGVFARLAPFEVRDGVVGLRRPLAGLTRLEPWPGTVALLAVMIGTVTFDGLSQGRLWKETEPVLTELWTGLGLSLPTAIQVSSTVGLLLAVGLVALFYLLGIAGARSVGGSLTAARLRVGFIHSLVPIAVVYVAAHYLTYLLFQGQAIAYLTPDPFGQGWNLPLGSKDAGIDYSLISQNATWYLQVGFVVAGHVAALVLAHDRALVLYGQARLAVRSQYWMLGIMVGFTTLALWLLAQAGS